MVSPAGTRSCTFAGTPARARTPAPRGPQTAAGAPTGAQGYSRPPRGLHRGPEGRTDFFLRGGLTRHGILKIKT